MLLKSKPSWWISENQVTPESIYHNRRSFMKLAGKTALSTGLLGSAMMGAAQAADIARNPDFADAGRPLTNESDATTYNNFYEFGSHKKISKLAQTLNISPWNVQVDGLVENAMTIGFEDLLAKMPLEERIYRLRCVEAWAMTVPWTGFALRHLVALAKPTSEARYLEMTTLADSDTMPGLKQVWYPWPYIEGLSLAEANNDLAFIATGMYGKTIPKQNGAPLRLAVPWKYGFKSVKSIVRFRFTKEQPVSFWQQVQLSEYGFWANVNPEVPHQRWSQASERLLGEGRSVPTTIYNGYGDLVADLYKDMDPINDRVFT